ncbi:sugar nucleotide-binding protein [Streptomyces sp. NA04227]|uniref:SDR family oxidoreductase n=1 Tax=Streptomyces sp. NA04227 TaxID=2742136 RepID=UPI0015916F74|nr:sugar nucleotide-binding protein [Streptomyces sp. NA04227]QKW09778.1 sugar nucleotide-binding protein [Streptomyces sp. NA04227]
MSGWLVTGAGGVVGRELCEVLRAAGQPVLALGRSDLDLTDTVALRSALGRARPRVVVNCAAYTDLDGAERDPATAHRVNAEAVRELARACARTGARLLHLSTARVFDGKADLVRPESASPTPHTAYGRSRLAGERAVLEELPRRGTVVRTSWVYGTYGDDFVTGLASRATAGAPTHMSDEEHGQPTWARDVAQRLHLLGSLPPSRAAGLFHATCTGRTTRYGLAREVYRLMGADPALVRPLVTAPPARPAFTLLGHNRWASAGLTPLRPWPEALAEALTERLAEGGSPDARRASHTA